MAAKHSLYSGTKKGLYIGGERKEKREGVSLGEDKNKTQSYRLTSLGQNLSRQKAAIQVVNVGSTRRVDCKEEKRVGRGVRATKHTGTAFERAAKMWIDARGREVDEEGEEGGGGGREVGGE